MDIKALYETNEDFRCYVERYRKKHSLTVDEAFIPWLMDEVRIIFSHPENFCFAFGMSVILGVPMVMVAVIVIMNIWEKVKKK